MWGWSVGYPEQSSAGHSIGTIKMKLDVKDRQIIEALRENSSRTIRDLERITKIKRSTIHQRITRLKNKGIIKQFTIKLDNDSVDEGFIVFIFISTNSDLPDTFFDNKHIKEAFGITGEYDLLLKLKFKDANEFNSFILSQRKRKEITKTITSIATITKKEET